MGSVLGRALSLGKRKRTVGRCDEVAPDSWRGRPDWGAELSCNQACAIGFKLETTDATKGKSKTIIVKDSYYSILCMVEKKK
jgi:hypothetical protein